MTAPHQGLVVVTLTADEFRALVRAEVDAALAEHAPARHDEPLLLTCSRLCQRLGVSRATVYRWRKEGMPAVRCGDDHRYEIGRVLEWIRGQT